MKSPTRNSSSGIPPCRQTVCLDSGLVSPTLHSIHFFMFYSKTNRIKTRRTVSASLPLPLPPPPPPRQHQPPPPPRSQTKPATPSQSATSTKLPSREIGVPCSLTVTRFLWRTCLHGIQYWDRAERDVRRVSGRGIIIALVWFPLDVPRYLPPYPPWQLGDVDSHCRIPPGLFA